MSDGTKEVSCILACREGKMTEAPWRKSEKNALSNKKKRKGNV